jgi:hypothetical protein
MRYLIISVALAAAGAIYEHFSFGVYSNFMIYAFAFPLIGGTMLHMLRYIRSLAGSQTSGDYTSGSNTDLQTADDNTDLQNTCLSWTWHAGIATLTVGSIVHGILEISGRPNSLTIVYLIAGTALLICAVIQEIKNRGAQQ